MFNRFRTGLCACALAVAMSLSFASVALAEPAGSVHYFLMAGSPQDQYTSNPAYHAWYNTHIWRMGVFSPYFDEKTSWYPNGWVYDDAYAIYSGSAFEKEHPEYILKGAKGERLYIPFACSGGTCPQYAGDISSPGYRQAYIENLKAEMAHGYRGVFLDDVNMEMMVGNGNGEIVAPIDRATGKPMLPEAWRGYMAQFMKQIREALPTAEITQNIIWYAGEHAGTSNPNIRLEIESANYINLERGANDGGLTGGSGGWSLQALLSFVDEVHALGKGVVLNGVASDPQGLEYNLAAYFLISTGNDGVTGGEQTPANWWSGWSLQLGNAAGARYAWHGLLRRDYSGGMVLVNEADEPTQNVELPSPMVNAEGNTVTSVTLPAASGAILRNAPEPPGEQPAPPKETETPTKTVVETPVTTPPVTTPPVTTPPVTTPPVTTPPVTTPPVTTPPVTTPPVTTPPVTKPPIAKPPVTTPPFTRHWWWGGHLALTAQAGIKKKVAKVRTQIAGKVLRATRGAVTIAIEARRHGRWVRVARLTAAVSTAGSFASVVDLTPRTHYRVRADYAGAHGFRPSRSRYVVVVAAPRLSTGDRTAQRSSHSRG